MLCVVDLGAVDPAAALGCEWDQLVTSSDHSGFMQSSHWALMKRRQGFTTLHLGVYDGSDLIGGAIFYAASNSKGAGFLVAPDGPVLPWDNASTTQAALQLIKESARTRAAELGIMAMRIAPRLTSWDNLSPLEGFESAPIAINEHRTLFVDLQRSEAEILAGMKPKARYNISVASRNNVAIRQESDAATTARLYEVMQTVAQRNDFYVEPYAHFAGLLNDLLPNGFVRLFFAEHEGDTLGALLMVAHGKRATYLSGGTTDIKRNLMAGYLLQWEAMRTAKALGCTHYDFWGYDATQDPEHPYAGFSRFKSQFGGEPVEFIGTLDHYFVERLADAVIRAINEISEVPA